MSSDKWESDHSHIDALQWSTQQLRCYRTLQIFVQSYNVQSRIGVAETLHLLLQVISCRSPISGRVPARLYRLTQRTNTSIHATLSVNTELAKQIGHKTLLTVQHKVSNQQYSCCLTCFEALLAVSCRLWSCAVMLTPFFHNRLICLGIPRLDLERCVATTCADEAAHTHSKLKTGCTLCTLKTKHSLHAQNWIQVAHIECR